MQFYCQRHQIQNGCIHLECNQEQYTKMFKHFGEKIPEESNVRLQITMIQSVQLQNELYSNQKKKNEDMNIHNSYINPQVASKKVQSLVIEQATECVMISVTRNVKEIRTICFHENTVFASESESASSVGSISCRLKYNATGKINTIGQKFRCVSNAKHKQHGINCLRDKKQKKPAKKTFDHTVVVCATQLKIVYGLNRYAISTRTGMSTKSVSFICNSSVSLARCFRFCCCSLNCERKKNYEEFG